MREPEDTELSEPTFARLWRQLRSWRGIGFALLASLGLHALVVVGMTIALALELPFAIQFSESAGIGMLSRVGRLMEGSDFQTAPRYTTIDLSLPPAPLGPTAPNAEEQAQMKEAQEAAQAAEAEEAERQATLQRQEQEAADAAARAASRQRRRERERLANAQAEAKAKADAAAEAQAKADADASSTDTNTTASEEDGRADGQTGGSGAEGTPNAGPDLNLPPGERYPTGTINPIATDLGMWGPEGARVVVVTRNDRLRRSPHAESIQGLLSSFPDWRTLVGGAELNPLTDVDTMVIASADPRYINQTFLAAIHHLPSERVIQTLSQGQHGGVTWTQEDGRLVGRPAVLSGVDPRVFFVPTEQIFVYTRPEFMDGLRGKAPTPRGMSEALELSKLDREELAAKAAAGEIPSAALRPLRPDAEPPLRDQGWLRGLMQIADYGGTDRNGAAIMISTGRIDDMRIQGFRGTMPTGLHANIFADADVRMTARAIFQQRSEADAFMRAWPDIVEANRSALTLTGLYRPLSEATLSIDHNETIIELTIPQATVRRLGVTLSQLMQSR